MDARTIDPKAVEKAVTRARAVCFIASRLALAQQALVDALADVGVHPRDGQALAAVAHQVASFESLALGNGRQP